MSHHLDCSAPQLKAQHQTHLLSEVGADGPAIAVGLGGRSIDAAEARNLGFRFKGGTGGTGQGQATACEQFELTAGYFDELAAEAQALHALDITVVAVIPERLDPQRWPARDKNGDPFRNKDNTPRPAFTGKNPSRWAGPDHPQLLSHKKPPSIEGTLDAIRIARKHNLPLGIGVVPSSTLVVVDFDAKDYEGGTEELDADARRLMEAHPELERTRWERTPSGGLHLFLRVADGMATWGNGRGGHFCNFTTTEGGPHRGEVLFGTRIAVTAPTAGRYHLTGDLSCAYQLVEVPSLGAIGIRPHVKERQPQPPSQQRICLDGAPLPRPHPQPTGTLEAPALAELMGRKARDVLNGGRPYGDDRSHNLVGFRKELHGVLNWLNAEGLPFAGSAEQLIQQAVAALGAEDKASRVDATINPSVCRAHEPDKLRRRYDFLARGGDRQQLQPHPPTTGGGREQQAAADGQGEAADPFEVTDLPPDLQAADLLHASLGGHVAAVADSLFRYDPATGCWEQWTDADATREAQTVLRRMFKVRRQKGEPDRKACIFGAIRSCRDAVASLKVKAGPGPLRDPAPPAVIVFSNGTFNLRTGQLEPHSPDHGATYRIEAPYVPGAGCPAPLGRVIETCFPEGAEPLIRALFRWVVDPTIRYGQAFHLVGDSGTGKGLLMAFAGSLLPDSLRSELGHPADLDSAETLHQFVLGRRLILFPDTPARPQGARHCGRFFELVENAPQTTRKLRCGEAERSRPMFARCLLGSVAPLQFPDGRDGFLRRVCTIRTLPRSGDPDPTLRDGLVGTTAEHPRIRGEAVSWALSMPLAEVEAVLNGKDPEGLLREAAAEVATASDICSQWADACLVPHPLGPDAEVDDFAFDQIFEAYVGWCRYAGVQYGMQRANFLGQLRKTLGPKRCLARRKESMDEVRARGGTGKGDRRDLPRFDAGFALRPGILHGNVGNRDSFDRMKIGTGGLEAIQALAPAVHPVLRHSPSGSPATPPAGMGCPPGQDAAASPTNGGGDAESLATQWGLRAGARGRQGCLRAV